MKPNIKYFIKMFLLSAVGLPLLLQFLTVCGLFTIFRFAFDERIILFLYPIAAILVFNKCAKSENLPVNIFERYLPLIAAFVWYMLIYILAFGLSGYMYSNSIFKTLFLMLTLPFILINMLMTFYANYSGFPLIMLIFYFTNIIIFIISCLFNKRASKEKIKILYLILPVLLICSVWGYQEYDKSQKVLTSDYSVLKIEDEIDLYLYKPFYSGNLLQVPDFEVSLSIKNNYPILDGATAAYPVYASMVQAIYKNLDEYNIERYVQCTKTNEAYDRLIRGEIDIFFGAGPSANQIDLAAENGIEFNLIPIAKEAFVFFVNNENPVDSLSVEQIQDIYSKKITNWNKVGGDNKRILPFQRPVNSGSQTTMQKIMQGRNLPAPIKEEYAQGMGGIISGVASYRNYEGAIGYSFRYYVTGMKPNEGIKLLSVNNIAPSVDNIRNDTYPFTIDVYAVTTKEPEGNVKLLIDWILSTEGQTMIEKCGYVRR